MRARSSKRAKALAISTDVKRRVYERDDGRCIWCGRPGLPEAHYIRRSRGGLGIEENVVTLCRDDHYAFDSGSREQRETMGNFIRDYLAAHYTGWSEDKLIYRRF